MKTNSHFMNQSLNNSGFNENSEKLADINKHAFMRLVPFSLLR